METVITQRMSEDRVKDLITKGVDDRYYVVTTDSNGLASVVFDTPHDVVPGVWPVIRGGGVNQFARVVSVTEEGFTIHAYQRATLSVLGLDVLAAATTNINGATVTVWVA